MNRLTGRWAAALPGPRRNTVFSAAGVWPLLAFLAAGAAGPARAELAEALGMRAEDAAGAARGLVRALDGIRGSAAAIGLWARPDLPLRDEWAAGLPGASLGRFGGDDAADKAALDAWAAERTGGLIPAMPLDLDASVRLVLAGALTVRTRWLRPFWECGMAPESGPWAGRDLVGLRRTTGLLDRVGVARTPAGPLTVLRVLGDTGVDVHLLLGEEDAAPGAVLAAGLGVLDRTHPLVPGDLLPLGEPGPGLAVRHVRATKRTPVLDVTASPFDITGEHDLTALAGVFGLTAATDTSRGHFPGVSDHPLAVTRGAQSALARFTEDGFEAAAVTALSLVAGGAWDPPKPYVVRRVDFTCDRPFGFLAVHRTSRLVLSAGWVEEPVEYRWEDEEEDGGAYGNG
ncbi:serpin family protein [Streptomyces sp. NPDC035033]|uniref:serpin family protein n=1 Tax=Streptomyces sp. NPDC035033 TaxID=3155368 RepID=UPI0033C0BFD5